MDRDIFDLQRFVTEHEKMFDTAYAELAAPEEDVFQKVLDKFFDGEKDGKTLFLLEQGRKSK